MGLEACERSRGARRRVPGPAPPAFALRWGHDPSVPPGRVEPLVSERGSRSHRRKRRPDRCRDLSRAVGALRGRLQRPQRRRAGDLRRRDRGAPACVRPAGPPLLPRRLERLRFHNRRPLAPPGGGPIHHGGPSRSAAARAPGRVGPARTAPHRGHDAEVDPLARQRRRAPRPHPLRVRDHRGAPLRRRRSGELGVAAPCRSHPVRDPDPRGLGRSHEHVARGDHLGVDLLRELRRARRLRGHQPVHRDRDQQPRGGEAGGVRSRGVSDRGAGRAPRRDPGTAGGGRVGATHRA